MGGVGMKTSQVLRVKTKAAAHIVFRNSEGKKSFEIYLPGFRSPLKFHRMPKLGLMHTRAVPS